jgi:hypothetical protein
MTALTEKRCTKCGIVKGLDQFYKRKASKDGRCPICIDCDHIKHKNYCQRNPVTIQVGKMVDKARARANNKNLLFDLDRNYIRSIVPSHCPIFNIPLEWTLQRGNGSSPLPNSPSLDRIDPAKGYVKGNVWIISHRANAIKNDASHEELKLVTEAVGRAIVNSLDW